MRDRGERDCRKGDQSGVHYSGWEKEAGTWLSWLHLLFVSHFETNTYWTRTQLCLAHLPWAMS